MLSVTAMSGFGSTVAVGPVAVSLASNAADPVDRASTYTFASQSMGSNAGSKKLVVFSWGNATGTISSLTIDGTGATLINTRTGAYTQTGALYYLDVSGLTSADIIVIWTGAQARCGIGVYEVLNAASGAPAANVTDEGASMSQSLAVAENGAIIGGGTDNAAGFTWGELTEDFEHNPEHGATGTGAHKLYSAAATATITLTQNADDASMCLASFSQA